MLRHKSRNTGRENILFSVITLVFLYLFSFQRVFSFSSSIETKNCRILYSGIEDSTASYCANLSENYYKELNALFPLSKKLKLPLYVILDDSEEEGNGYADYLNRSVVIYMRELYGKSFLLRGRSKWLNNVIAHEISHVFTIRYLTSANDFIPAFSFSAGMVSSNAMFSSGLEAFVPLSGLPLWLMEGLAQYYASFLGADSFDSYRKSLFYETAYNGKLLAYEDISVYGFKDIFENELVYNQGYAFLLYLNEVYSGDAVYSLLDYMKKNPRFNAHLAIKNAFGKPMKTLYTEFTNYAYQKALAKKKKISNETCGILFYTNSRISHSPKKIGDTFFVLADEKSDYSAEKLLIFDNETNEASEVISSVIDYTVSSDGKVIYYLSAKDSDIKGNAYVDLYCYNRDTERHIRLSENARFDSLSLSESENKVYLGVYKEGRKQIGVMPLPKNYSQKRKQLQDWEIIVTNSLSEMFLYPAATEKGVAYIAVRNSEYSIEEYSTGVVKTHIVFSNELRDLVYMGDGNYLYSRDENGLNAFLFNEKTREEIVLTQSFSAVFTPFLYDNVLYYSSYSAENIPSFVIRAFVLRKQIAQTNYVAIIGNDTNAVQKNEYGMLEKAVVKRNNPYFQLPHIYPFASLTKEDGLRFGAALDFADIRQKNNLLLAATFGSGSDLYASYLFDEKVFNINITAERSKSYDSMAWVISFLDGGSIIIPFTQTYIYSVLSCDINFALSFADLSFGYNFSSAYFEPDAFFRFFYYKDGRKGDYLLKRNSLYLSLTRLNYKMLKHSEIIPSAILWQVYIRYAFSKTDLYYDRVENDSYSNSIIYLGDGFSERHFLTVSASWYKFFRFNEKAGGELGFMFAGITEDVASVDELYAGGAFNYSLNGFSYNRLLGGYRPYFDSGEYIAAANLSFRFLLFKKPFEILAYTFHSLWAETIYQVCGIYNSGDFDFESKNARGVFNILGERLSYAYNDLTLGINIVGRAFHVYEYTSFFNVSIPLGRFSDFGEYLKEDSPRFYLGLGTGF